MGSPTALLLLAGSVAAQQITQVPDFRQALAFAAATVNEDDEGFSTCDSVDEHWASCLGEFGGLESIDTDNIDQFLGCGCCSGTSEIFTDYSVCSDYLEGASVDAEDYTGYGNFYSQCSSDADCAVYGIEATTTSTIFETEVVTMTSAQGTITSDPACDDMYEMFISCISETPEFASLPNTRQAECYCCRGASSSLTLTNEIDEHASTCWDWWQTADKEDGDTQWDYASSFATYCDRFSTVCDDLNAAAVGTTTSEEIDGPTGIEDVTVTVTTSPDDPDETDGAGDDDEDEDEDAASHLQAGSAIGLAAFAAMALWL